MSRRLTPGDSSSAFQTPKIRWLVCTSEAALACLFLGAEEFQQGERVDVALVEASHRQAAPTDLLQHLEQLERPAADAVEAAPTQPTRQRRGE